MNTQRRNELLSRRANLSNVHFIDDVNFNTIAWLNANGYEDAANAYNQDKIGSAYFEAKTAIYEEIEIITKELDMKKTEDFQKRLKNFYNIGD